MSETVSSERVDLRRGKKLFWTTEHHTVVVAGLRAKKTYDDIAVDLRAMEDGRPDAECNHIASIIHGKNVSIERYLQNYRKLAETEFSDAEIVGIIEHYQVPGTRGSFKKTRKTPRPAPEPVVEEKPEAAPPKAPVPSGTPEERLFEGIKEHKTLSRIAYTTDERIVMKKMLLRYRGVVGFLEHMGLPKVEADAFKKQLPPDFE